MTKIIKPMLAGTCEDRGASLDYENNTYVATPKLDGIRALMVDGKLVSRTFKPIKNTSIRNILEGILPDGADGEIVCTGDFQATASGVMRESGEPNFKYFMFDLVVGGFSRWYNHRLDDMEDFLKKLPSGWRDTIVIVSPDYTYNGFRMGCVLNKQEALLEYEQRCIDEGFEGVCVRRLNSPYKCGRSTLKEEYLLKIKRFKDSEAVILGFEEKMHNDNPKEKDSFGRTKRSSHKANKRPAGTMGNLVVRDVYSDVEFKIGTGFNDEQRQEIWDNQSAYLGKITKYKYFPKGVKDKPRHPVYLGLRHIDDMDGVK